MNNQSTNSQTIIAEDVQIDGDIMLSGNITIYGEIRGAVSTDGAIQLAKNGKIFGDVKSSSIQMNGYICSGWKRPPHFATDLTADHPLPTSKGGNEYQELVVYCRSCNSSKQSTIEMY